MVGLLLAPLGAGAEPESLLAGRVRQKTRVLRAPAPHLVASLIREGVVLWERQGARILWRLLTRKHQVVPLACRRLPVRVSRECRDDWSRKTHQLGLLGSDRAEALALADLWNELLNHLLGNGISAGLEPLANNRHYAVDPFGPALECAGDLFEGVR